MHDEENAIGLKVKNKRGDQWTMFGDKRLLDEVDSKNKEICKACVQASADEIYAAWKTGSVPEPQSFAFLNLVPDLGDEALFDQELVPLFVDARSDCARRVSIMDRRTPTHDKKWTAWATCATVEASGWWNYPITIDGPSSGTSNIKESRKNKL